MRVQVVLLGVHEPGSARRRRCAHTAADRTDRAPTSLAPTSLAAAAAALAAAAFVVRHPRLLVVAVYSWDGLPHSIEALSRRSRRCGRRGARRGGLPHWIEALS